MNYVDSRDNIYDDDYGSDEDEERKSEGDDYDLLEGRTIDEAYDDASEVTLEKIRRM